MNLWVQLHRLMDMVLVSEYGGTVQGAQTSTLNGGIVAADTTIALTDGSATQIRLASTKVLVQVEL